MQFLEQPPGNLTQEGSIFFADWSVADSNFGFTKSQVESWVSSALNDSRGIEATGIVTRQVTSGNVIFQVVETIDVESGDAIGIAYWNEWPVRVELEAAWFGNMDLVTHEMLHAALYASHSPEGSDSLLEPIEDPGEEWLSAIDIAQITEWLAGAYVADLTYWFPGDLEHYITKWPIPEGARTRVTAKIVDNSPCVLKPVWGSDHLEMVAGDYSPFGRGLELSRSGFFSTPWQEAPTAGDTYVGLIIDGATEEEFDRLVISHAEVQIVGAELTGGGSPIPN